MLIRILLCWFAVVPFSLVAQNPTVLRYGNGITSKELKDNLSVLASDVLEGRGTGTRGQKMAAAFIASHFEEIGLKGPVNDSYFQRITLYSSKAPEVHLEVSGDELTPNKDFIFIGSGGTGETIQLPLHFAGKGTEVDLNQVDVRDKAVLIFPEGASIRNNPALQQVRNSGAKMIFAMVEKEEDFKSLSALADVISRGRMSLTMGTPYTVTNLFILHAATGSRFMKSSPERLKKAMEENDLKAINPVTVAYSVKPGFKEVKTENVLGFLEGSDKKEEVLVITAHYDHIGKRNSGEGDLINNGADDDGSGTVAVMAIASAFAKAKQEGKGPRRSILFMTVTAEEVGLLGSQYYTNTQPVYPLEKNVVNLNIDMIGRSDPKHQNQAPYVYVIGSDKLSTELHRVSESVNKKYTNLVFDYTYNDPAHPERLYYRSDHWNFASKNIPVIFYFDGIHEDYHKPSDEVSKIDFDLLTKRTKCIFYTAWEIANRENRIMPDVQPSNQN